MNAVQFISQFDLLFNNVMSNQAPGLDDYEKGVFLTKAQNQFLIDNFSINNNTQDGGFDATQKRQYDFSKIVKIAVYASIRDKLDTGIMKMHPNGERYALPKDFFFIVNEEVVTANKVYSVYPLHYLEYKRLMMKPYQMPPKNTVWRLIIGQNLGNATNNVQDRVISELIGTPNVGYTYRIRYVKRPKPIVLYRPDEGDPDVELLGINVDDIDLDNPCELPEETHQEILDIAVALAKEAYTGTQQTQRQYDKQRAQ